MQHYLQHLEQTFKNYWGEPAVHTYNGECFTFAQSAAHIASLHLFFEKIGIHKGDHIALCAKNTARWAISFLAINTYGTVIVPILSDFTPPNITKLVNHSDSVILFTDSDHYEHLSASQMPNLRCIVNIEDFSLFFANDDILYAHSCRGQYFAERYPNGMQASDLKFPAGRMSDIAIINYTSGTSSDPKGVMLTYGNVSASIDYAHRHVNVYHTDHMVSMLPMAHIYGLVFEFLFPLTGGCEIYFLGRTPAPSLLLKAMQEVRPFMICTVPLVMEKIYRTSIKPVIRKPVMKFMLAIPGIRKLLYNKIRAKLDASFGGRVRHYIMGGAALNPEVDHCLKHIGLHYTVGYGMTEAAPLLAYVDWREYVQASCGRAVDCADVRIDSPDPANIVGEIQAKGDNICVGYYKNEAATTAAFTEDGFLHTGDLGLIDKRGNVFIKGRSKSMILSANGQNIYPEEIESLIASRRYVAENVVVDREGKLVALVYLNPDTLKRYEVTDEDLPRIADHLMKSVNRHLPDYSKIAKVELRSEPFEKTPKLSIKRFLYS